MAKVKQLARRYARRGWAAVSGRIALHLDQGLGWTSRWSWPAAAICGTELARDTDPDRGRAGGPPTPLPGLRHPQPPARLPGTTSPATDLALPAAGRTRRPPPLAATPPPHSRRAGRR